LKDYNLELLRKTTIDVGHSLGRGEEDQIKGKIGFLVKSMRQRAHNRWQVWMALLAYVLLRYLGYQSDWNHSFSRLCTMVRGVLWEKSALRELLVSYGTAGGHFRMLGRPDQVYLPGFT
jgi:hypothetical protein